MRLYFRFDEPVVFLYWIVPVSRGFSVVIVEQATESLPSHYWAICGLIVGWLEKRTDKALMRALYVVVGDVLADSVLVGAPHPAG